MAVFEKRSDYLPLHTGLEFIAMAVSLMVFGLGWNLRRQAGNSHGIVLAAAFLSVRCSTSPTRCRSTECPISSVRAGRRRRLISG